MHFPVDFRSNSIALKLIRFNTPYNQSPSRSNGDPVIGWGTKVYPSGCLVGLNDRDTNKPEAEVYLRFELDRIAKELRQLIDRPLTGHQIAALISLVHSIGIGSYEMDDHGFKSSLLRRSINFHAPEADIKIQWMLLTTEETKELRSMECELWCAG